MKISTWNFCWFRGFSGTYNCTILVYIHIRRYAHSILHAVWHFYVHYTGTNGIFYYVPQNKIKPQPMPHLCKWDVADCESAWGHEGVNVHNNVRLVRNMLSDGRTLRQYRRIFLFFFIKPLTKSSTLILVWSMFIFILLYYVI